MGESFEAKLIQASSKEVFKKAKQILHKGALLCCHEISKGVLRAVCRDEDGFVSRAELRGFPNGPFSGSCTCRADSPGFCPHAMAAALYHAKYTIKSRPTSAAPDLPAQYAGLRFAGLPELLTDLLADHPARVVLETDSEFPHVPSKWERVLLNVRLVSGKRDYLGNLNNLRQLHFDKSAAAIRLTDFPQQDRQIIRYLAINAQQDGTKLSLNAEQCTEFFHCLVHFQNFTRKGEHVIVHSKPATPVLLLERVGADECILKSAIVVNGSPLPLKDVKLISGRNGCWVGMLGEYWWIPAMTDVAWLRNFLRTTIQPCDTEAARVLLEARDMPVRVIPSDGVEIRKRKFRPVYDGFLRDDGSLELEVFFDYGTGLCSANRTRLGSQAAGAGAGVFWLRNTKGEDDVLDELIHFGFREHARRGAKGGTVFRLRDREAVAMFLDEMLPRWRAEGRRHLICSELADLCSDSTRLTLHASVHKESPDWYELAVSLKAGETSASWRELAESAARNETFLKVGGRDVRVPDALRTLASMLDPVVVCLPSAELGRKDAELIRIPRQAACYWANAASELPGAVPLEFLRIKLDYDSVRDSAEPVALDPELFHGSLRPYQTAGVAWLAGMTRRGCNLILADEMGLGKTVQTLAFLASSPERQLPALIICPTTLLGNWMAEIARFLPRFRALAVSGPDREPLWKEAASCDIVVTSYALAKRDLALMGGREWKTLILDEAQHIKNPQSLNAQTCKQIPAAHKLILTGTPLENSVEDLWSIFDFLHPGLLGPIGSFRAKYAEILRNAGLKKELSRRIAPFMLRRRKSDVCKELPPKQEQLLFCEMENGQRALYERMEEEARRQCDLLRKGDKGVTRVHVLASLMRLRQICCDPRLLPDGGGENVASAKTELLIELLNETLDSGHKVLLFSQFTSMLKLVRGHLDAQGVRYEYLDGSTRDRTQRVEAFNRNGDVRLFLLSLKAGGLGLNLTSADTVILFDPWWNPAIEDQAADRTHRIGQTKSVNCIRLAVKNSIEERVLELHERKRALFDALVEDSTDALSSLSVEDFEFLLGGKD